MNSIKRRKGFTLIELVIVVAIIGILALMIIPKFASVTESAKKSTFDNNCQTVLSAYAMYQADKAGATPSAGTDLDAYISGGFNSLNGKPAGATYTLTNGKFTGEYTGKDGKKTFTYPD